MCDMLGISTSRPVPPNERLLRLLFQRGRHNPDGWGVAWYDGRKGKRRAQVIKSPRQATLAIAERFIKQHKKALSPILIAHLRGASTGRIAVEDTHPFHRTLFDKEYVFAHNGHLANYQRLPVGRFRPHGQTDSERAFCHLLHCMEQQKIRSWTPSAIRWLARKLRSLNKDVEARKKKYGKLNILMSDGERLFFYHDINGFNSYWTLQQPAQDGRPALLVISMCKLTRGAWKRARKGKLIVVKNGKEIGG